MKTRLETLELITYGCGARFDPSKFKPITNCAHIKPKGGLWASPVDSEFGWKDWASEEHFGDLSHHFTFTFTGKVFRIDGVGDLRKIPWVYPFATVSLGFPDYEQIARAEVDAIHLTVRGQVETRWSRPSLCGWDCESVLIMNPAGIQIPVAAV